MHIAHIKDHELLGSWICPYTLQTNCLGRIKAFTGLRLLHLSICLRVG